MRFYFILLIFIFFHLSSRGNTIITTLYAIDFHANPLQVGFIVALGSLFPMMFAIYAGKVADRLGHRLPIIFGTFGVSLALLLPYFFREKLFILYLSQSIFGLGYIFTLVTTQSLIGSLSSKETRSSNFAANSLSISIASLLGPSLTGIFIDNLDYGVTYLFLSILAIIPGVIFICNLIKLPETIHKENEAPNRGPKDLLFSRRLRKTFITSGVLLTGIAIYEFYFPIYGRDIGLSATTIGIILSINASAYFIVRLFMKVLINKFNEEVIFSGCLLLSAMAFIFIPFFDDFFPLALSSFVLGLGLGCGQPLSIVMAYNRSPEGRTGEVLGIRLTVNKIVQFLVPILFGSVGSLFGFFFIFWSNALLFFVSGFISSNEKDKEEINESDPI